MKSIVIEAFSFNLYGHSLFTLLYATRGAFGPGKMQRSPALCVYMGPLDPRVVVAPIFLHPFTPHVGPLDLIACKEAALLYWVYGSIRPMMGFDYSKS